MPEFTFSPDKLRSGFAMTKIVKPDTGDYCLRFDGSSLVIFSYDKRKYVRAVIPADVSDARPDFLSKNYFITMDRSALFNTDLDSVVIKVNDKSLTVTCIKHPDQDRKALLKRKSVKSRRPDIPPMADASGAVKVDRGLLDKVLYQVSCSALVRETKTEEDMRVNQVHLYSDSGHAISNARYYGSLVHANMGIDLSIVSSDIPVIRAFCTKCSTNYVYMFHDDERLSITDEDKQSVLSISKVSTKKPSITLLDPSLFSTTVVVDRDLLLKNVEWAASVVEGTQRVTFDIFDGVMKMSDGSNELAKFPVTVDGGNITADYPIGFMLNILKFIDNDVVLKFGHKLMPTVMEVTQKDSKLNFSHYLQSMRKY